MSAPDRIEGLTASSTCEAGLRGLPPGGLTFGRVVDVELHPVGDARAGSPTTPSDRTDRLGLHQGISYCRGFVRARDYR